MSMKTELKCKENDSYLAKTLHLKQEEDLICTSKKIEKP